MCVCVCLFCQGLCGYICEHIYVLEFCYKFDLRDVYVYVSALSQMFAQDTVTRLWQMGAVLTSYHSP